MKPATTLIVGVGSPHGDDQAGWQLVDLLGDTLTQPDIELRKATTPMQLIDWLSDIERLIVCDACQGTGPVGAIQRRVWPDSKVMEQYWAGTHDFSLPAVLKLADKIGRLPRHVVIWAIEGGSGDINATMSLEVVTALPPMANMIADEVRNSTSLSE